MPIGQSTTDKRRLLIFHPALAPYRVDQFNFLSQLFDLTVVFVFENVNNQNFDQRLLREKLLCRHEYLLRGPTRGDRCFRWGLLACIQRHKADIVMGYEFSPITQFLLLLKKAGVLRQAIGSTIDDSLEICLKVQSWPRKVARELGMAHLDFMVVLSSQVAEFYARNFQFDQGRIVVAPLLQNPASLRAGGNLEQLAEGHARKWGLHGRKVILYVGRFAPEKGLEPFIRTIAPLLTAREEVRLLLVGEGTEGARIEATLLELGISGKVLMPGRSEGTSLHAWYLCASGFVLPSTYEPFGAVINEALIFGLNVLCSKYAGSSAMAARAGGLLFDPRNPEDTRTTFERHLETVSPLADLSLASRPSRAEWNTDEMASEWAKLQRPAGPQI